VVARQKGSGDKVGEIGPLDFEMAEKLKGKEDEVQGGFKA